MFNSMIYINNIINLFLEFLFVIIEKTSLKWRSELIMNVESTNICCDLKDIRQSLSHASQILYNKKDNFDICNINALDYITKTLHTAQREIENKKECCLIIEEKKKLKEWKYTLDPEKRKKDDEIQ